MPNFSMYSLIQKKRDGEQLSSEEIKWIIKGVTDNTIPDYQTAALLMAMFIRGLNDRETADLTDAMLYSGKVLDFKDQTVIDKHSTGGVGDKTSFILAPIAAAAGVKVPMIAGRGLGHTGGTVDKIEAIPGFNTEISLEQFAEYLQKNGVVLIGQTADIAPADKKLYALRDVTGTVESIPLITGSIMSKKLAEGASGIVMDIKTGSGAFMDTLEKAQALGNSLAQTALRFNKNIITIISDMSQPLGLTIGNSLEIIESIETLKGKGPEDLTKLSVTLAGGMIYLAGLTNSLENGIKRAQEVLDNGLALKKFRELIRAQGGNPEVVDNYNLLPSAKETTEVLATENGYIETIDGKQLGLYCVDLGGGRKSAGDKIDYAVGFTLHRKVGENVTQGESLLTIHHHSHQQEIVKKIQKEITSSTISITNKKPKLFPLVFETKEHWSNR